MKDFYIIREQFFFKFMGCMPCSILFRAFSHFDSKKHYCLFVSSSLWNNRTLYWHDKEGSHDVVPT